MKAIRFSILTAVVIAICTFAHAAERPPLVMGEVLYRGPLEKGFIEIETDVPGFAGWYKERDGSAVVLLKDIAAAPQAIERVSRILDAREGRGQGAAPAPVERRRIAAKRATFSFSELAGFRHLLTQDLPDGVYTIDVDEVRNVVSFGVSSAQVEQKLRANAARLRIPPSALSVRLTERPQSRSSLSDYHRPVRSGLAVTFGGSTCTVGINAIWNNDPTWVGFFTASHCGTPWTVGSAIFNQGGSRVGYEGDDVAPVSAYWCPYATCRYSDAAWVAYDYQTRTASNGQNTLALPSWQAYGQAGATDFDAVYTINGEALPYPSVGDPVFKVGATTGWTYGYITQTCEDAHQSDFDYLNQDVWLLCQERSDVFSAVGDSGSGVFTWVYQNGQYYARFAGILWGGPNRLESWHASSWNIGVDFPQYSFYY